MANGFARMTVGLDSHWLGAAGLGERPAIFLLLDFLSSLPLQAFVALAQVEFSASKRIMWVSEMSPEPPVTKQQLQVGA